MNILVTGGGGLVGSACVELLATEGHSIISIDNNTRGHLWKDGSTIDHLEEKYPTNFGNIGGDLRYIEWDNYRTNLEKTEVVIHTAAQPSHPYSVDNPEVDFYINAVGTFNLLEACRKYNPSITFITCSSNKVYGDYPNYVPYVDLGSRYDFDLTTNTIPGVTTEGITEEHPIDRCLHTPFGVSKVAADLYTQEYGKLYGMRTGVFRMGCITGSAAKAVEQHNWIPHIMKVIKDNQVLKVFGYEGKQVRDIIHANDLARLFLAFIDNPKPGQVWNVGGGRANSISMGEAIDKIQDIGKVGYVEVEYLPGREGDHRVYYTDMSKVHADYPEWKLEYNLDMIFEELWRSI
jgi:CDP-paratose 2-epimerase